MTKKRLGEDACPFNSLYWNFLDDKTILCQEQPYGNDVASFGKNPPQELAEIKARAENINHPDAF